MCRLCRLAAYTYVASTCASAPRKCAVHGLGLIGLWACCREGFEKLSQVLQCHHTSSLVQQFAHYNSCLGGALPEEPLDLTAGL